MEPKSPYSAAISGIATAQGKDAKVPKWTTMPKLVLVCMRRLRWGKTQGRHTTGQARIVSKGSGALLPDAPT